MSTTTIRDHLLEQMKLAMKSQQKERLATIRLIQAAFKQKEVDERIEISDPIALAILEKMVKQRRDSIDQFTKANRNDLAEKENSEIHIIQEFLPSALTAAEINELITKAIAETSATSIKDMAKVIAILKPAMLGRADLGEVGATVRGLLGA